MYSWSIPSFWAVVTFLPSSLNFGQRIVVVVEHHGLRQPLARFFTRILKAIKFAGGEKPVIL